eukprot:scaffold3210_cov172-Amphora_coffeaeformis.AAC.1
MAGQWTWLVTSCKLLYLDAFHYKAVLAESPPFTSFCSAMAKALCTAILVPSYMPISIDVFPSRLGLPWPPRASRLPLRPPGRRIWPRGHRPVESLVSGRHKRPFRMACIPIHPHTGPIHPSW